MWRGGQPVGRIQRRNEQRRLRGRGCDRDPALLSRRRRLEHHGHRCRRPPGGRWGRLGRLDGQRSRRPSGRRRPMKQPFELEWMGGVAEHHFRHARPGADDLPWGTLDPSKYAPEAVDFARGSWTEVAINEYRAVASFSEVLRAMVDVKAPLDLLGMTSDFLADECSHVELASRMAMELGGAAPRTVDLDRFAMRPT